jgi:hypothetical protein
MDWELQLFTPDCIVSCRGSSAHVRSTHAIGIQANPVVRERTHFKLIIQRVQTEKVAAYWNQIDSGLLEQSLSSL